MLSREGDMIETTLEQPEIQQQVIGKKFSGRAFAYIIDVILLVLMTYATVFFWGLFIAIIYTLIQKEIPADPRSSKLLDYAFSITQMTLYFIIFECVYGATLGKLILGMRVIMDDGKSCSFKAAVIRGLLRYIDGLFFAIPAYTTMKAPLYKRIGDNSAHTFVVGSKDIFIKQPRKWWWFIIAGIIFLIVQAMIVLPYLLYMFR
jgi:uncharacterized RDD family membrane protein YckC